MAQSVLHRLEREERRLKALAEKRVLTDPWPLFRTGGSSWIICRTR